MKKFICCLLAVILLVSFCACGKTVNTDTNGTEATPSVTPDASPSPVPTAAPDTGTGTDEQSSTSEPDKSAPEDTQPVTDMDLAAFVGDWHEAIAGRGMMTVTLEDGNPRFEVRWANSAFEYNVFRFVGIPDGTGVLRYEGGYTEKTEYIMDSEEESKTTVDDAASGTVRLTEDGTIIWTEDAQPDNPHEFVKD